jgi:hypothetical protein
MTHGPLHGTNGMLNNRWIERWVYFLRQLFEKPLGPRDTSLPDYRHAVVDRDFFPLPNGLPFNSPLQCNKNEQETAWDIDFLSRVDVPMIR